MKTKEFIRSVITGGIIAAAYAALSFVSSALGIAFGPVQFRLSEALCVLPIYTPSAIWGLTLGCVISNIASPLGIVDIVFGSAATLLAAVFSYLLRNTKFRILPLMSPVICNAVIVGTELSLILGDVGFFAAAAGVAVGEAVVILALGLPITRVLDRKNIFKQYAER